MLKTWYTGIQDTKGLQGRSSKGTGLGRSLHLRHVQSFMIFNCRTFCTIAGLQPFYSINPEPEQQEL